MIDLAPVALSSDPGVRVGRDRLPLLAALDIEVHNVTADAATPAVPYCDGLDPRQTYVTSVAVHSAEQTVYLAAGSRHQERNVLGQLYEHLRSLPPATVVVTWNGSGFDLPTLHYRANQHPGMEGLVQLAASNHRPRKYPPLVDGYRARTGHDGGYVGIVGGLRHADIAEDYRDYAEAAGVRWSLKPVAAAAGLVPYVADRAALHAETAIGRAAYNVSDVVMTLALADQLEEIRVDPTRI